MTDAAAREAALYFVSAIFALGRSCAQFIPSPAALLRATATAALLSAPGGQAWAQSAVALESAATASVVLPVSHSSRLPEMQAVLTVSGDYGGFIAEYMKEVDRLRARRVRVEITGECRSACTLYLGAGNVCVSRTAMLRFHGPSRGGRPFSDELFESFSRRMAGYYPEPVRSWFMTRARYRLRGTLALSGTELIRLGVPEC